MLRQNLQLETLTWLPMPPWSFNRELVAQNDRLRSTLSSNVAERADAGLPRENERLQQQEVLQFQTKLGQLRESRLLSA